MPMLTLDKIAVGRAVLVDEEGNAWEIPADALPEGSAEGDILDLRLRKRKGASKKLQNDIKALQERLERLKRRE